MRFLVFSFQIPKTSVGGGGGWEEIAGDELSGLTSERGNVGPWTVTGDGDAATCCKWVGFPPEFFPSWLRLL